LEEYEMMRVCNTYGGKRNIYRIFMGKPEGKRPLGRPRRREYNVKMDLGEIGWGVMDRIDLVQDIEQLRFRVNMVMNLRVPKNFGKFFGNCATGGFSRRAHLHGVCCLVVKHHAMKTYGG
jgi:hypothetical protein